MSQLKDFVKVVEGNKFKVSVNTELYDKEAIVASAYKYSGRFYIYQNESESDPKIVDVFFESKENSAITEADVKEGKESIASNYLIKEKNYNNNISFLCMKISSFIEKSFNRFMNLVFKELEEVVNG